MNLLTHAGLTQNMLPYDGEVLYYENFLDSDFQKSLWSSLFNEVDWQQDRIKLFGKIITTKRRVAWFSENNQPYTYSNNKKIPVPFFTALSTLKNLLLKYTELNFNACLANYYGNGTEGMGWHRDNEKELGPKPNIASLSLGARRRFDFRHVTTKEKLSVWLEPGSLLLMKGETQKFWQHQLPVSKKVKTPRINLTFRQISI